MSETTVVGLGCLNGWLAVGYLFAVFRDNNARKAASLVPRVSSSWLLNV